jgi:hypothetical protein
MVLHCRELKEYGAALFRDWRSGCMNYLACRLSRIQVPGQELPWFTE